MLGRGLIPQHHEVPEDSQRSLVLTEQVIGTKIETTTTARKRVLRPHRTTEPQVNDCG